jgi:hypothetical protein
MPYSLDDRLNALAGADMAPALDGLESSVWSAVQAQRTQARAGAGVRVAMTIAALALGLAFGAMNAAKPTHLSEMGVLSEDGLLAPSIRLGGGA